MRARSAFTGKSIMSVSTTPWTLLCRGPPYLIPTTMWRTVPTNPLLLMDFVLCGEFYLSPGGDHRCDVQQGLFLPSPCPL